MKVDGIHYRTIWVSENDPQVIQIIDQRHLPHSFVIEDIKSVDQMAIAIKDMHVRGAGLIGAAAGYGMYLAVLEAIGSTSFKEDIERSAEKLLITRPTAVNLAWAVRRQCIALGDTSNYEDLKEKAFEVANNIADEDVAHCKTIGTHGLELIRDLSKLKQGQPVNILTHCNAGWLAFVDHGSATAPIYSAYDAGINVHVWVDETRPRNQGSRLTAWELLQHGVPHTIIADNTGGHLMQHGMVDLVLTGTDRTTYTGDVANKIGTYLKALAAKDNGIPFYVALPSSSFDWKISSGVKEIPIEKRNGDEVKYVYDRSSDQAQRILLSPEGSPAVNYAFDVTPARLITGLITERGICQANEKSIRALFPPMER